MRQWLRPPPPHRCRLSSSCGWTSSCRAQIFFDAEYTCDLNTAVFTAVWAADLGKLVDYLDATPQYFYKGCPSMVPTLSDPSPNDAAAAGTGVGPEGADRFSFIIAVESSVISFTNDVCEHAPLVASCAIQQEHALIRLPNTVSILDGQQICDYGEGSRGHLSGRTQITLTTT